MGSWPVDQSHRSHYIQHRHLALASRTLERPIPPRPILPITIRVLLLQCAIVDVDKSLDPACFAMCRLVWRIQPNDDFVQSAHVSHKDALETGAVVAFPRI